MSAFRDFLVEIGTEELPPKSLLGLSQAFADGVATSAKVTPETADSYVRERFWQPRYLPFVKA